MVVEVTRDPDFGLRSRHALFVFDSSLTHGSLALPASYDVTPNGDFVFRRDTQQSAQLRLLVKVNWLEELNQLVATGGQR